MSERTKNSVSIDYQVGDIVKFIGVSYGTPHSDIGVVVSTDNGPFKDPDDPKMIQISFNGFLKYVSISHPQPQLETILASLREGELPQ
jgi:hypothetical protein